MTDVTIRFQQRLISSLISGNSRKISSGDYMHFDLLGFYGGPDQVMTITSGIASLVGFLLIFWHKVVNAFFRLIGRGPKPTDASQKSDDTGTTHS